MSDERAQGHSKLVYNKASRTIDKVDPHPPMTSPREQAIEAVASRHYGTPASVRAIIDDYERTRARIDGAKMMPREATEEMLEAGIDAANSRRPVPDIYRAMHDATPKEKD